MSLVFNLCFPHLGAGPGSVLGRRNLDFAHAAIVTHDVLLQRTEQPLGMLGREICKWHSHVGNCAPIPYKLKIFLLGNSTIQIGRAHV